MKSFLRVLGDGALALWPGAAALAVMTGVGLLCGLTAEGAWYGLGLGLLLLLLCALARAWQGYRRVQELRRRAFLLPDAPMLPPPGRTEEDAAYLALYARLLEAYEKLREETARQDREREDYYTLWVHQIKTPISALELLLSEQTDETASAMRRELRRVEQYANIALAYLRVESFHGDLAFTEVEVRKVARAAVKKLSAEFIHRRLTFCMEGVDGHVLTDEKWLLFLLEQLLSNAVKYTREGGVTLDMPDGRTLSIADTGIGIRAEDVPRVFERGFTGYNGREYQKSTGIGLYLCKMVAKKLQIDLSLQSAVGRGTTVTLRFPEK
ncbi:MAG: HAMP domain-containing histidine kinase [Clostridia bacterium]|nr:HAMP domain-containing histidine kinase [Clostridia bacterium]